MKKNNKKNAITENVAGKRVAGKRAIAWKMSRFAMTGLLAARLLAGCSAQPPATAAAGKGSAGSAATTVVVVGSGEGSDVSIATGAWDLVTGDTSMKANPEAQAALEKAIAELNGADYEPIALIGTQVVAGTNYCILCRVTPVVPDAEPTYALAYVYEGLDGACELINTTDLDVAGGYDYDKAAQAVSDADEDAAEGSAAAGSAAADSAATPEGSAA